MTPTELRNAMGQLGISPTGLARLLRLAKNGRVTVYRWLKPVDDPWHRKIPGSVEVILESYLKRNGKLPNLRDYR